MPSAPASPTTRRSTPTCRASSATISSEDADPAERRDPYLPRAGGLALHARQSERAGGEAGGRVRRLRHRRSARARSRGRARGVPRASCRPIPANYISQPMVEPFGRPTLVDDGIEPRHVDLRPFAVTGPRHLGAARRADPRRAARGARWSSIHRRAAGRRTPGSLPSLLARYAECIFWLARYVERAENLARILDVTQSSARRQGSAKDWAAILEINSDLDHFQSTGQKSATTPSSCSTCSMPRTRPRSSMR